MCKRVHARERMHEHAEVGATSCKRAQGHAMPKLPQACLSTRKHAQAPASMHEHAQAITSSHKQARACTSTHKRAEARGRAHQRAQACRLRPALWFRRAEEQEAASKAAAAFLLPPTGRPGPSRLRQGPGATALPPWGPLPLAARLPRPSPLPPCRGSGAPAPRSGHGQDLTPLLGGLCRLHVAGAEGPAEGEAQGRHQGAGFWLRPPGASPAVGAGR